MLFGNRGARSSGTKQRKSEAFRPRGEALEQKVLLTLLQLGAGTPKNIAGITTTAPAGPPTGVLPFIADSTGFPQVQGNMTTDLGLGVLETNNVASQGAGYSVAGLGDINGDGSNDYLIGAPTVTGSGSVISPGTGTTSEAYLIFGDRTAQLGTVQPWATNPPTTPEERVGVLANAGPSAPAVVGSSTQTNPFTNRGQPYNFNFDGIAFKNDQPTSQLGAFVAAAGPNAFVIGAPNYTMNGAVVGRLYYITAPNPTNFNALSLRPPNDPVDLDQPGMYPGLTIITFEDTTPNSGLGSSFAYATNLLGGGSTEEDLVVGEPGATVAGAETNTGTPATATNTGGVFVFPLTSLPTPTAGMSNPVTVTSAPLKIAGVNSGDEAGFSVADAGDVNGTTGGVNDLLIGAPGFNMNAGAAYLVYGGTTLTTAAKAGNGVVSLSQLQITPITTGTTPVPTPPQGAVFVGTGTDRAGSTVSSAGDFNPAVSSLDDFMIGSPGPQVAGQTLAGRVNLFYGVSTGTINSTGQYTAGLIANVTNPIHLNSPTLPLNLTGVAPISASFVGASAGDRAGFSLSYMNSISNTPSSSASVILIGAPGNITAPGGSGSVYELLGPTTGTYTTQFQPLNSTVARQYTLSFPTTFSSSSPINFGSSVSAYAGTGATGDFIAGGPGYTGIQWIPPTSGAPTPALLGGAAAMVLNSLQPANTLIPLLSSPMPTPPTPTPSPTSSAVSSAVLPGTFHPTNFISPLGTSFVPTVSALSAFNYAPIPLNVALQQYLPPDGFIQRDYAYNYPGKKLPPTLEERGQTQSRKTYGSSGVWTLGSKVFTRGRFHPGKTYQFTHKGRVVPAQLSREKYTSEGNPLGKV